MDNRTPEKNSDKSMEANIDGNGTNVNGGKTTKVPPKSSEIQKQYKLDPTVIVAIIGAAAAIIVALLDSPLIVGQKEPTSTPSASITQPESPATEYLTAAPIIVVVTSAEAPVAPPSPTFAPTLENIATALPSPEPKADKMTASLRLSDDEGKAPLKVNFDARASYVQFPDGSTPSCGNNSFCSYDFSIYCNSKLVEKRGNHTGMLSYTFGTKGQYFIAVYVCRGNACDDDGVTVNVK